MKAFKEQVLDFVLCMVLPHSVVTCASTMDVFYFFKRQVLF